MSLLLHAITSPPGARVVDAQGLRGAALARLDVSGLTTWSTELAETPSASSSITRDDMLDHHRVVSDVFARVDACLPARFPTLLRTVELETFVQNRFDDLLRQLDLVRGACELAITAVWSSADHPAAVSRPAIATDVAPGRTYLLARQRELAAAEQRRAQATALADTLDRELAEAPRATRREICPSPLLALSYAVLLALADVETVKHRIPRVAPDVRILVNGPWPPYTFASVRSE
jgi:hypothetical protein